MNYPKVAEIVVNSAALAGIAFGLGLETAGVIESNHVAEQRQQLVDQATSQEQAYKQEHLGATEIPTIIQDNLLSGLSVLRPKAEQATNATEHGAIIVGISGAVLVGSLATAAVRKSSRRARSYDELDQAWTQFREREALADSIISHASQFAEAAAEFEAYRLAALGVIIEKGLTQEGENGLTDETRAKALALKDQIGEAAVLAAIKMFEQQANTGEPAPLQPGEREPAAQPLAPAAQPASSTPAVPQPQPTAPQPAVTPPKPARRNRKQAAGGRPNRPKRR